MLTIFKGKKGEKRREEKMAVVRGEELGLLAPTWMRYSWRGGGLSMPRSLVWPLLGTSLNEYTPTLKPLKLETKREREREERQEMSKLALYYSKIITKGSDHF